MEQINELLIVKARNDRRTSNVNGKYKNIDQKNPKPITLKLSKSIFFYSIFILILLQVSKKCI